MGKEGTGRVCGNFFILYPLDTPSCLEEELEGLATQPIFNLELACSGNRLIAIWE